LRIDCDGGLGGQLLRLTVGLAGQLRDNHRLGRRGVLVAQQVQRPVDRPGLGQRKVAVGQQRAGAGQQGMQSTPATSACPPIRLALTGPGPPRG
jgi:hypothetical protein